MICSEKIHSHALMQNMFQECNKSCSEKRMHISHKNDNVSGHRSQPPGIWDLLHLDLCNSTLLCQRNFPQNFLEDILEKYISNEKGETS